MCLFEMYGPCGEYVTFLSDLLRKSKHTLNVIAAVCIAGEKGNKTNWR